MKLNIVKKMRVWLGLFALLFVLLFGNDLRAIAKPLERLAPAAILMKELENPPTEKGIVVKLNGRESNCFPTSSYHLKKQSVIDLRCWLSR
jgi:hypothetical protein